MSKSLFCLTLLALLQSFACGVKLSPKSDLEDLRPSIPYRPDEAPATPPDATGVKKDDTKRKSRSN